MKSDWIRRLTVDWPCAFGDWLWWALVIVPADLFERIRFKRIILITGFLVLLYGFGQIFALDIAIVFAADAIFYFDVVTAVLIFRARRQAAFIWRSSAIQVRKSMRKLKNRTMQLFSRSEVRRRRRRKQQAHLFDKAEDSDDGAGLGASIHGALA